MTTFQPKSAEKEHILLGKGETRCLRHRQVWSAQGASQGTHMGTGRVLGDVARLCGLTVRDQRKNFGFCFKWDENSL